jgi:glycosyltransferase involved in cell wall biosynthesis
LVVLEAAALGVPVVSFDNGGVVQFAASDPDGPLAEIVAYLDGDAMADAIASLSDDTDRRLAQIDRARRFVLANQLTEQAAPRLFETLCSVAPSLASARSVTGASSR